MTEKKSPKSVLQMVMMGLLVVAAFAIGSMWTELRMLKGGKGVQQEAAGEVPGEPEEITELTEDQWQELLVDPAYASGEEGVGVTIVELTDYQCPFCKRHVDEVGGQIEDEYISTGKVRYMFRDLPLSFHQNAHLAAQAARCAGDQGQYWGYHDKLFETQALWGEVKAESLFKGYAGELGLNQGEFDGCLDEGKYKQAVDDDLVLAAKVGASGTPTFFINGKKLVGAQPWAAFQTMIDEALGE